MTRNLQTADHIVKLVLASGVIALYLLRVIAGPFAFALLVLSLIVIALHFARLLFPSRRKGR